MDEAERITLEGNTHPLAQPQFDRGAASPNLPMERMLLVLKRSPSQESSLQRLLAEQQDRMSPYYHKWLSADEFGRQFGPSDQDLLKITTWLAWHGFQIARVTKGRTVVEFSGTASQVQQAFHTEIHKYEVNGIDHWANASDPQIPATLMPVVGGITSLHNFPKEPAYRASGIFSRSQTTGEVRPLAPDFTYPNSNICPDSGQCYAIGPFDFATIYNVLPLWNSSPAIDGTGQRIAIVGESNINLQDVRDFRKVFGLPPIDPVVIIDGPDPGILAGLETEADLDVEWAGAVATGATIELVVSASTNSTAGVDLSALYIIENNLAPVVSESFNACEAFLGTAGNSYESSIREQAAAQGITFINSSGDQGSAGCDEYSGTTPEPATQGLAVNGLASSPFDVAVGGTDFVNFGPNFSYRTPSPYWAASNDTNQASALGYIPESTWNSSCTNIVFVILDYGATPEASCNNSSASNWVETVAGGGGKSSCTISEGTSPPTCSGGYAKPSWQSAPGVPNDGARDVPDVSLFASSGFMGSFYIVCESDLIPSGTSCNLNSPYTNFSGFGGTSASAPAFAGIMALVNQYSASTGQGNANYVLYKLGSLPTQSILNCSSSAGPASGCIFNDVTAGTIAVPCARNSPNCNFTSGSDTYGLLSGYSAGTGYDLSTGLGSVNAYNLVHNWSSPTFTPTMTSLLLNNGNPVNIVHGQSVPVTIGVTSNSGTPSGDVSLLANLNNGAGLDGHSLVNGFALWQTAELLGGTYSVKALYGGDGTFASSDSSPIDVTVMPEPSNTTLRLQSPSTNGGAPTTVTSGVYGSILRMDALVAGQSGFGTPTGKVSFLLDGAPLSGSYSLNANGETFTPNGLFLAPPGQHSTAASYGGDPSFNASNSPTIAFAITQAPTALTMSSVGPQVLVGEYVDLRASMSGTSCGVQPSGTITFFSGGAMYGSSSIQTAVDSACNISGGADIVTSGLPHGPASITAVYSGDANYKASTSPPVTTDVVTPTTMTVIASNTQITEEQPVTFTATVTSQQNGGPPITGTVQFTVNGVNLSVPVSLSNGLAQLTTTSLQSGNLSIAANYSGDINYAASSGNGPTENVSGFYISSNGYVITVNNPGSTGSITLDFYSVNGFTGTVTLTPAMCSGLPPGTTCSFNPSVINITPNHNFAQTTLTITTTGSSAAISGPSVQTNYVGCQVAPGAISILCLLCMAFLIVGRRCGQLQWCRAIALVAVTILLVSTGCGGNGGGGGAPANSGTPPGLYTNVVVTVTVNGVTASTPNLSINVL